MNYSTLALLALAIIVLSFSHKFLSAWQRRHLPFPPGPSPLPLLGNFRDLPTTLPWLTYTEWGLQYGSDIVHASALGQHIVVVNSVKAAVELFEKRSHINSDRPVITMIELMGWDFSISFLPLRDRWRMQRRMFEQHFRRDISRNYRPIQMGKIHQLLLGLLAAAIVMATVYGYEVQPNNDHFVALSENVVKKLAESFFPGAVAVNTFPILRYLPSWMPGAGFKRFAAECRQLTNEMREVQFDFVKQNMRDGVDSKSVVARLLEANQARGRHDEVAIQDMAATAYAGIYYHSQHTASALASFFLAMATHPDVQKKAQTEIDTVVGSDRLPEFEDRPALPFVEALYREVMRWKPVTPLGVAHASAADDIYNGYFIPNGNFCLPNLIHTAMTRDESIYPEPERFNPDRFFTVDGKLNDDNTVLTFGFGRRICPGRHSADDTVWATIVSVLSTFDIVKARDAVGNEININPNSYSDGFISHPKPFPCSVIPRSETAKHLVQAMAETHDFRIPA
ncbi:cytochrome P450 [Mycena haematopus]|nr:cytochrome P450 [Mycena haematopus]